MMNANVRATRLLPVACLLLLTACGGGSGDAATPAAPPADTTGSGSGSGSTNQAPTIAGSPGVALSGAAFEFTPTVIDPDGDALTFSASGLPAWLGFDAASGRFHGTAPAVTENVSAVVGFTVSDGSHTVTTSFTITTAPDALEEAILTGDHRYVTDESVYVNALYDAIGADVADGSAGADEAAVKTLVQNLENDTFSFDLVSACYGSVWGSDCTNSSYRNEFGNPAARLKAIFDGYDEQKYDLFAHADAPRYQKLLVLLADHIRSTISLPVSIGLQHDFLRTLFADHIVHVYREVNPAQPDMGNFSRSDFSGVTPVTATVELTSRQPFRAAGVYALPGQTVAVARNDSSPVTVKVGVNSQRDIAVREFATTDRLGKRGYNRPKFVTSPWMEIGPGETLRFTSPYGGPVQVSFDSNDEAVSLTFSNVGRHPFWSGPEDTAAFLAALAADQYDRAEFVTPDFELHTSTAYMNGTLIKPWIGGDPDTLYDQIVTTYMNYPRMLAGYRGDRIDALLEVQDFASANGLVQKTFDVVQHFNADQAGCSTACGGSLIDTDSSFSPWSVTTDLHELGHALEPLQRFSGWGQHTTTDLYPNYTEYRTQGAGELGATLGCYDRDYKGLFDIVQASRDDADPGATMRADIAANDAHGLMVFQQLMAMAQQEGALTDGWDLLPEWQVIEREYADAIDSDTLWAEKAAGMGFDGMSRTDAAALSVDDRLLIMLSKVENRNLSAWLELWGIQFSDAARLQVASLGYADAPLVYYAMSNQQACSGFTATSVPIDGVSAWPL